MDELAKIEFRALKTELLNWQTLRFTLLGFAAAAVAAFLGWMATAGSKIALGEVLIPVLLLLLFSVAATVHAARMIIRSATYFEVFYESPWDSRLSLFRASARPLDVNHWIAAIYAALATSSFLMARRTGDAGSRVVPSEANGFAWLLRICLVVALVVLALSGKVRGRYVSAWNRVKAEAQGPVGT